MIPVPSYLANFQSVIDAFGYWPGFHDSPVLHLAVDEDEIEMEVEAWETGPDSDEGGFLTLIKKHAIGFRFSGLERTELESFPPSNILFYLGFSPPDEFEREGLFVVELDSAMGCDMCGRFSAKAGEVTFVRPLE